MRGRDVICLVSAAFAAGALGLGFTRLVPDRPPPAQSVMPEREPEPEADLPAPVRARADVSSADLEAAGAIARETQGGHWNREAIERVRSLLHERSRPQAIEILALAGIDRVTARQLRPVYSSSALYRLRIGNLTLLTLSFVRVGTADWELTPESFENLRLPFHATLPSPLQPPPSLGAGRGRYERCEAIGRHRFVSDHEALALRCTLEFRGQRFVITTSEDLLRDDWSFADRIDTSLSNIPTAHLALIKEIVLDPGDHPSRPANASTSWDGTRVNMFLCGMGKRVPQQQLDGTTAHEFGHVVSLQQSDALWIRWEAAIRADKLGVSMYGLTNRYEDFAETYVLYLGGGARDRETRARYPGRFAILDTLF
jgi:hypothetical protein